MKSWIRYTAIGFLVFSLTACNAEPEVGVDNEVKDGDAAGIELTTQVNGVFKGFEGDDPNKVIIDYEGEIKTYEVAEDASGDFDMTVCQIKCNTCSLKASFAVFQPRHFLGRLLINASAFVSSSDVT